MKASASLIPLILCAFTCACSQTPVRPTQPQSPTSPFAPTVACSLPSQVARDTPFANLGGGSWERWAEPADKLAYGCEGGKDDVRLLKDSESEIIVEYSALGGADVANDISVEYSAYQYTGQRPIENQLRQRYADFCDALSVRLYGMKLPPAFKTRLLNESAYSTTDSANEYAEKVGGGYVRLSSIKTGARGAKVIMLDVHFFASEEEFKIYNHA